MKRKKHPLVSSDEPAGLVHLLTLGHLGLCVGSSLRIQLSSSGSGHLFHLCSAPMRILIERRGPEAIEQLSLKSFYEKFWQGRMFPSQVDQGCDHIEVYLWHTPMLGKLAFVLRTGSALEIRKGFSWCPCTSECEAFFRETLRLGPWWLRGLPGRSVAHLLPEGKLRDSECSCLRAYLIPNSRW